jgi:hypothetical protein
LQIVDSFDEAMLSDVRLTTVQSSAGALIDLRMALGFGTSNAAVLVLTNVTAMNWAGRAHQKWCWRTILGSRTLIDSDGVTLKIGGLYEREELTVRAQQVHLYLGNIPELDEFGGTPPDFVRDTDDEIYRRLPAWSSQIAITEYWNAEPH